MTHWLPLSNAFVLPRFTALGGLLWASILGLTRPLQAADSPLPLVTEVERQPLAAQIKRLVEAMGYLGVPLTQAESNALEAALTDKDSEQGVVNIQNVLD